MRFIVDKDNKIILGWSPKCACSHIKKIYYFLRTGEENNPIHKPRDNMGLPENIEEYTSLIFIRNPYKRIISGFLDKYARYGEYRPRWKHPIITFELFVDELIKNEWDKMIEYHHFTPQTSEKFHEKVLKSKSIFFYDIEKIDYNYIEKLYNKKIPDSLLNFKGNHSRKKYKENYQDPVYNLEMKTYFNCNVPINLFYNKDIKNKIYNFYKGDFQLFKKYGIDYEQFI